MVLFQGINSMKGIPRMKKEAPLEKKDLYGEIRELIASARQRVAIAVNAELSLLYWHVGKRINEEILGNERADYGKRVIEELSVRLTQEFGSGWKRRQLFYCVQFATEFPDSEIVHTLCAQLSWSHIKDIIAIEDGLRREFYTEMCKLEHWSVRTLRERIDSMMYERTAIAKKPEALIKKELTALRDEEKMSPDLAFRDPYFLDFLGLHGAFSEKDLESAMIAEMKKLLLELGGDMAFLAEQKRISVDNEDYYIDLLFYHRRLKRLSGGRPATSWTTRSCGSASSRPGSNSSAATTTVRSSPLSF